MVCVYFSPDEKPGMSFYLKPLTAKRERVWYSKAAVGINTLRTTVSRICREAGFTGLCTNHSLRTTAATRLYEAGIEEQLITEITGHRSESVREYKRTSEHMKRRANNILSGNAEITDKAPRHELSTSDIMVTGKKWSTN